MKCFFCEEICQREQAVIQLTIYKEEEVFCVRCWEEMLETKIREGP